MKRSLPHYMALAEIQTAEFAKMIEQSPERVFNWLRRKTPIFVTFDLKSMEIEKVTNESVVWYVKDKSEAK